MPQPPPSPYPSGTRRSWRLRCSRSGGRGRGRRDPVAYARSRDPDHTPGTAEIVAIYVDPDHWYGGTGTRLLDRAATEIATLGFVRTTLWVLEKNTSAIRFYAKHGFQPDACPAMTIDMGGTPLQELRYVRGHGA